MVALVACATGCAPVAKPPTSAAPPPASGSPTAGPGTPASKPAASASRSDSLPSPDAERLLATIPEPLSPSQQVPPDSTKRRAIAAPEAAYDTLRVQLQTGEAGAVPVPAPTPVAAAPVVTFAPPESTSRAAPPAPAPASAAPGTTAPEPAPPAATPSAAPAAAAGTGATAPSSGPCWRVQVAAPATRAEAESRLEAAQSLLVVPMAIVPEKGLFKVRTSDCMTRETADSVKRRALDSGFDGSFLVDTAAAPKPAAPKKKSASGARR
jgi:hypothetical protein